jgi:hypothetical protein
MRLPTCGVAVARPARSRAPLGGSGLGRDCSARSSGALLSGLSFNRSRRNTETVPVVDDPCVTWLTDSGDPAVAALARTELLGERPAARRTLSSPIVETLLSVGRRSIQNPYTKWSGAHWRLVSAVELGVPPGEARAVRMSDSVLAHWSDPRRLAEVRTVRGLVRRCASVEGNAVATAVRLGLSSDPRVQLLVEQLLSWQWPDGGWNCDDRLEASHSSFHETLPALWGLHEYAVATGDGACKTAVTAGVELLLEHEIVFSRRTGEPIHPSFVRPHYPPYWHYDLLQALLVVHRVGRGTDPRTEKARKLLAARRKRDGTWRAVDRWWRPPGSKGSGVEVVDWGEVAHQMTTLNALRVGA